MDKSIEQTLIEQNAHWQGEEYQHAIIREHNSNALADLRLDEIQIITGIRRCGKSTLLQTLINQLKQDVHSKSILYINFDDPNYTEVYSDPKLIRTIVTIAEKLADQPIHYLLLDEVQNVERWEQYIKSVYDSKQYKKIIVTGSNSNLLNSDYATLLSGRYTETRLYPLSYSELLMNHNMTDNTTLIKRKAFALKLLDRLLKYGGFPRIHCVQEDDQRLKILKGYYETILLKDCIQNHHVRDTKTLINLAYYLISHISSLYSYNSLSKALNSNENTIQNFIQILQNSYFFDELFQFSYSLKQQTRSKKKIYCIDNGLISAATFKFSHNFGKLLENLVYSELKKRESGDIYFFNDQKECDFIVHHHHTILAIQVCYELNHINRKRELDGLSAAMQTFSIAKGIIITYDKEETITDSVEVVPFWKFWPNFEEYTSRT